MNKETEASYVVLSPVVLPGGENGALGQEVKMLPSQARMCGSSVALADSPEASAAKAAAKKLASSK